MKYIWFLYLKECGYAFVDDPSSRTPAPVTPLSKKRPREANDDPLPSPKKPRIAGSSDAPCSDGEDTTFDTFPEDDVLFECSQSSTAPMDPRKLSGNDLFMSYRAKRQSKIRNFSVTFTIGLLYLALQYTHQKIMLSDLKRYVSKNFKSLSFGDCDCAGW